MDDMDSFPGGQSKRPRIFWARAVSIRGVKVHLPMQLIL